MGKGFGQKKKELIWSEKKKFKRVPLMLIQLKIWEFASDFLTCAHERKHKYTHAQVHACTHLFVNL